MPCWKNKVLQLEQGTSGKVPPLSPRDDDTLERLKVIEIPNWNEKAQQLRKEGRSSIAV
jgi:hypothetical protein